MKIFSACIVIAILASCSKGTGYVNKAEVNNQKIDGAVKLYDEFNNEANKSGMTVSLEGTSYSAITDSGGRFELADIPYGTYNVVFTKSNYGTYIYDTLHHISDGDGKPVVLGTFQLGQKSSTSTTATYFKPEDDTVKIYVTTDPPGTYFIGRGLRLFYGADTTVSSTNYTGYSQPLIGRDSTDVFKFNVSVFYDLGFVSGQKVFVRPYGEAYFANDYTDISTGKRIFPNLNPNAAPAQSFILP